ncbi:MAG: hypothetical protein ABI051_02360 [Vicinamibacterales bacterium]
MPIALDGSGRWMEIEDALPLLGLSEHTALPAISHGMCEECHRVMEGAADDPVSAASDGIGVGALASVS